MWFVAVLGLFVGALIGLFSPLEFPEAYVKYLSVAILAALDSVFGGIRSTMEETFDNAVFLTGFFGNALLAASFAYLGDRLGVELYMAAIVAFGVRIFQNFSIIRRHLLKK